MLVALTLSLSLVNPTCTATAESRDMELAVIKARQVLILNGCDIRNTEVKRQEKVYPNGVTVYTATVTVKESK